jgi:hypothetical protein
MANKKYSCNLSARLCCLMVKGLVRNRCAPVLRRVIAQNSISVTVNLNRLSKSRPFNLLGMLALLGLAFCVFAWGLQYKLSLYDPPQTASHQIPTAKLLSRDEQSSTTESPLVVRTRTSHQCDLHRAYSSFLDSVAGHQQVLNPPVSRRVEKRTNRLFGSAPRCLKHHFVRPPPVLA